MQSVLIVDDSAIMRAVIRKALRMSGHAAATCLEASDGLEALAVLRGQAVDLVFADLNMPQMGGDALIDAMSADSALERIPVIIVSTEGSETRLEQIVRPQVVGRLRKPFTPEQFREAVQHLVGAT